MALPAFDVEFTREGRVYDSAQVDRLIAGLEGVSDLLVLCHGWNNDLQEAQDLYDALLANVEKVRALTGDDGRTLAVCRVFWPSKKFTDEELIPGGGAVSASAANDASLDAILDALASDPERLPRNSAAVRLDDASAVRRSLVDQAKSLARQIDADDNQTKYLAVLRSLLDPSHASGDDASEEFFTADPARLFKEMAQPVTAPRATKPGGAAGLPGADGSAAGLRDLLSGTAAAARRLANYATYYQMKTRAGTVGSVGLAPILQQVRKKRGTVKIHLVGHSFGARVVTAAANALDAGTANVTVSLLQAAYSHNGLAKDYEPNKDGFFRSIVADRRVSGPIIITHTKNDSAVGVAYPLASRIANQKAAALGDENDPYGGMGRNGAQHTPEVDATIAELRQVGTDYGFQPGHIYNLLADAFIHDHNDVAGPQVAAVILATARAI
jgi:hypothetical protein